LGTSLAHRVTELIFISPSSAVLSLQPDSPFFTFSSSAIAIVGLNHRAARRNPKQACSINRPVNNSNVSPHNRVLERFVTIRKPHKAIYHRTINSSFRDSNSTTFSILNMASVVQPRQALGVLDSSRLQALGSIKNRQNGM
jgi:hypothetical protein